MTRLEKSLNKNCKYEVSEITLFKSEGEIKNISIGYKKIL